MLTVQEVATLLKVCPETVRNLCRRGIIPAVKVGRQWRIQNHQFQAYLKANTRRPQ